MRRAVVSALALVLSASVAHAADLPAHRPIDVFVIGDEVNPNGLSDAQLTQPGDIPAALNAPDSGVNLVDGGAVGFDSQCVDDGLERLEASTPPAVLVYFAHRAARLCGGGDGQARLVTALEAHLERGGGMVVFHHGLYVAAGKEAILDLIGAESNSIAWNTMQGQRIFNVAPDHFVTSHHVVYAASGAFPALGGVAAGTYQYFDNVPDERYPITDLTPATDPERTLLFTSDSGGNRAVGFVTARAGWKGKIVAYQSGEYQPNALDDRDGNNFQILANAIAFAAGEVDAAGNSTSAGSGAGGASGSGGSASGGASTGGKATATGGVSSGGVASGAAASGGSSSELPEPPSRGGASSGGASGFAPPVDGGTASRPIAGSPGTPLTGGSASLVAPGGRDTGTGGATTAGAPPKGSEGSSKDDDGGCSVFAPQSRRMGAVWVTLLGLAGVVARLRRRISKRRA